MPNAAPPPERTPARGLVWLTCDQCKQPLVPVDVIRTDEGPRTVIRVLNLDIFRVAVRCPVCGAVRDFRSQKQHENQTR